MVNEKKLQPTPLKYTFVKVSDVYRNRICLNASAYNLEAISAIAQIKNNRFGFVNLWSENGLVGEAYHRPRFKRIYVDYKAIPFYQPSSITEVYPRPSRYISQYTPTDLEQLKVKKDMLLMTISGTIGKITIAGKKIDNQIFSHDLLRLQGKGEYDTGYIYAYFLTEAGQHILQSNNYGAVIKHIEPEHFKTIIIPNAPESLKKNIHQLVMESYRLRDDSNDLIDQAEQLLIETLKLPPIEELENQQFDKTVDLQNFSTKLSELRLRLDASFHLPQTRSLLNIINQNVQKITTIGDTNVSKQIILPGRFKRVYVNKEHGIPFFGGKQLLSLNPVDIKYLSLHHHNDRIKKQLFLKENMIAITCSGTIGKVNIIPRHWENWTLNQHVMRIVPAHKNIAGYIYCWLNTEYGYHLIKRHTYGSVVDEVDAKQLSEVEIPILKDQNKQQRINDLVLQANQLRYQAHLKEQEAISKMEDIIKTTK